MHHRLHSALRFAYSLPPLPVDWSWSHLLAKLEDWHSGQFQSPGLLPPPALQGTFCKRVKASPASVC